MAFNTDSSNSSNNNTNATRNGGAFEEAKGFINMYLPTTGGGRVKLHSIPLKESDKTHRAVLAKLADPALDDEARAGVLLSLANKIQFEFNPVEKKEVELAI